MCSILSPIWPFSTQALHSCQQKAGKKVSVQFWKIVPRNNDSNRLNSLFSRSINTRDLALPLDVWATRAPQQTTTTTAATPECTGSRTMFHHGHCVLYSLPQQAPYGDRMWHDRRTAGHATLLGGAILIWLRGDVGGGMESLARGGWWSGVCRGEDGVMEVRWGKMSWS